MKKQFIAEALKWGVTAHYCGKTKTMYLQGHTGKLKSPAALIDQFMDHLSMLELDFPFGISTEYKPTERSKGMLKHMDPKVGVIRLLRQKPILSES